MKKIAVFMDRDGTMVEEAGYLSDPGKLRLLPNTARAVRKINQAGLKAVVVSNQSGVARGYYKVEDVEKTMARLTHLLEEEGAFLDKILYCPHHKDGIVPEYARECDCRKPGTGLMEEAARELSLDLSRSYMIGDKVLDIQAGHNFGGKSILVLTGYGRELWAKESLWREEQPDYTAEDLLEAVDWIVRDLGGNSKDSV